MTKKDWIRLAEEKESEIKSAMKNAYIKAYRSNFAYHIDLCEDGKIDTWASCSESDYTEKEKNLKAFCIGVVSNVALPDDFIPIDEEATINKEGITIDDVLELDGEEWANFMFSEFINEDSNRWNLLEDHVRFLLGV